MQRGFAPIILIFGVVLLIAIGLGGYIFATKPSGPIYMSPLPAPIATPSEVSRAPNGAAETASWKTYKSSYGYQIKYPSYFSVEASNPESVYEVLFSYEEDHQPPHGGYPYGIFITIEKPIANDKNITAKEYAEEEVKNSDWDPKPKVELITVGSAEAAKIQTASSTWSVSIFYKSKIYRVSTIYGSAESNTNYDKLFDQILSTFTFTN